MPSFDLPNFKYGMDQRRERIAGAVSTLYDLQNAHITRGGDVQGCKAFVPVYALPAGCFGLVNIANRLYTFGSATITPPPGITYQKLTSPTASNMVAVLSAVAFIGNTYVIAKYDDGNIYHFYNGSRVTDWDTIAAANCSFGSLTDYLAELISADPNVSVIAYSQTLLLTSLVPGVATTVLASVSGATVTAAPTTVQNASPAIAEIPATGAVTIIAGAPDVPLGANEITQVTVGSTALLAAPVSWTGSQAATANALVVQINNNTAVSGYTASAAGATVTISAVPGQGATPNGLAVATTTTGTVTTACVNMAGGVAAAAAVAQIVEVVIGGTLTNGDVVTVTIGGVPYVATALASGTGVSAYVFAQRIYSTANTHLAYCTLANPADWTNASASSGAGFINMASATNGSERLVGCAAYGQYTAVFSARSVRLYLLTADATQVSFFQYLNNHGSFAANSFQPFAATDVFYIDVSGVRSLRERDTTYTAYANDVGAAVDTPVQAWLAQVGWGVARRACSVIEPLDERYWVAIGTRIWLYSYFPATQIGAWSHYDPGFSVLAFATIKNQLYALGDDNNVYLYGGVSGQVYPAAGVTPASFVTPFHSPGDPEAFKIWTTVEIGATGVWSILIYVDPDNLSAIVNGGTIVNSSYRGAAQNLVGHSQLFSLQMTCASAGYRSFSSIVLNYLQKAAK